MRDETLQHPVLDHLRRDVTTLRAGQTAQEALASLRASGIAERIVYFYVVDDAGRLVGVVPTRRLLMAAPSDVVRDMMVGRVVSLPHTATILDACEVFVLHRFLAVPVVDEGKRLLGVVDVGVFTGEMVDVGERREADDVFQLIGIHLAAGRARSPWSGFRDRFPWLLCNVVGGTLCALLLGTYEAFLDHVLVLALFIPVVLALSESVGMQSMTITLQSLHGETASLGRTLRALGREASTSALLGVACGTLVGALAWAWKGQARVAVAIGTSIGLSMLTACLLGVALPTALRAFRRDPKIAAGPIVLATADLATLLFYFRVAAFLV